MAEDERTDRQILLSLEGNHQALALEVKEMNKAQEQMYTSLFGVKDTQNGGFIGSLNIARDDIKENHQRIEATDKQVGILADRQKPSRKKQASFLGTIATALLAIIYGLGNKLGWW
jgi:hypothetical protein|tara:strand:- start:29 stop:376 length:348 start_codon:yes stop_codon:yes gene_type:complete